jgi:hypothetical protein
MIKILLSGVWGGAVALVAAYVTMSMMMAQEPTQAGKAKAKVEPQQIKASQISVPIIADGKIQGYVLAQLTFTIDGAEAKRFPSPMQAFLADETFRTLYAEAGIDFRNLKKQDLPALARSISQRVNKRLAAEVVMDAQVDDMNYVPIESIRSGAPKP